MVNMSLIVFVYLLVSMVLGYVQNHEFATWCCKVLMIKVIYIHLFTIKIKKPNHTYQIEFIQLNQEKN